MKNVVKSSKHFFGYFNTLKTHSVEGRAEISVIFGWDFGTNVDLINSF